MSFARFLLLSSSEKRVSLLLSSEAAISGDEGHLDRMSVLISKFFESSAFGCFSRLGGVRYCQVLSNRVRVELLVLRKCVDPDENARRVEVHENLCFHSQFGSTFVPLSSPATAGGLLELRACSSTYIPTSDRKPGGTARD